MNQDFARERRIQATVRKLQLSPKVLIVLASTTNRAPVRRHPRSRKARATPHRKTNSLLDDDKLAHFILPQAVGKNGRIGGGGL